MSRSAIGILFPTIVLVLFAARPLPGRQPAVESDSPAAVAAEKSALDASSKGNDAEGQTSAEPKDGRGQPSGSLPPLSSEMSSLRDQLRRTLAQVYARPLNTRDHLPAEIIAFCEAFGHKAEIVASAGAGQSVNAVGALCWNFPCGGYQLFRTSGADLAPRVGYGYQRRPGQLLAMLASNGVPQTYEIRAGEKKASVAGLVAAEKEACLSGTDLSGLLVGLSFYAKPRETWKNARGEAWSVERIAREELERTPDSSTSDVIDRLAGLSFALVRIHDDEWTDAELPVRIRKHIAECQDFAFRLQNSDGSWHPDFFAHQGSSNDAARSLRSTGAILAWLAFSMPEEKLADPRLIRSLQYVNQQLASRTSPRGGIPPSTLEVLAVMSGVRAISFYDARYFTPRTPPEPRPETNSAPSSGAPAARPASAQNGPVSPL